MLLFYPEGIWDGIAAPASLVAVMRFNIEHPNATALMDNYAMWETGFSYESPQGKPTHWMPLPEPPTK